MQAEKSWEKNIRNERHCHNVYTYLRTKFNNFLALPNIQKGYKAEIAEINIVLNNSPEDRLVNYNFINLTIDVLDRYLLPDNKFEWLEQAKNNKLKYLHGAYYTRVMHPVVAPPHSTLTLQQYQQPQVFQQQPQVFQQQPQVFQQQPQVFQQQPQGFQQPSESEDVPIEPIEVIDLNKELPTPGLARWVIHAPLQDNNFNYCKKQIFHFFDMQTYMDAQDDSLSCMINDFSVCYATKSKFKWLSINNKDQLEHLWESSKEYVPLSDLMITSCSEDIYYAIILAFHFFNGGDEEKQKLICKIRSASKKHMRRARATETKQCNFEISKNSSEKLNKMKQSTGMTRSKLIEKLINESPLK